MKILCTLGFHKWITYDYSFKAHQRCSRCRRLR
jgi:hypothetical protein